MECSAPILCSLILSSITMHTVYLSQSALDAKELDSQWLLARVIEVGTMQKIVGNRTILEFFD